MGQVFLSFTDLVAQVAVRLAGEGGEAAAVDRSADLLLALMYLPALLLVLRRPNVHPTGDSDVS